MEGKGEQGCAVVSLEPGQAPGAVPRAVVGAGRFLPCPFPTPNPINRLHISPGVGSAQDPRAPITHVTGAEGPQIAMVTETTAGRAPRSQRHPSPTEGPAGWGTAG